MHMHEKTLSLSACHDPIKRGKLKFEGDNHNRELMALNIGKVLSRGLCAIAMEAVKRSLPVNILLKTGREIGKRKGRKRVEKKMPAWRGAKDCRVGW